MKLLFTFVFLLSISTVFAQAITVAPNEVVSTELSGPGTRAVYADSMGKLTALQRTYTTIISPQDFKKRNSSTTSTLMASGTYADCYVMGANGNTANDVLVAPVKLPVGAIITRVQTYYTDNDPVNNLSFLLNSTEINETTTLTVVSLGQNTNNSFVGDISTQSSGRMNEEVTENKIYRLQVSPVNSNGTGVWSYVGSSTNYMSIKGVKITYVL